MKIKREMKFQIVPEGGFEQDESPVAETQVEEQDVQLPAVYYGDRDGGDIAPQPYRQTTEMREQSGGQLGVERGKRLQEDSRQQRIAAEAKAQTERLNRTGYL